MRLKKLLLIFSLLVVLFIPGFFCQAQSAGGGMTIVSKDLADRATCAKGGSCSLNSLAELAINVANIILGVVGGLTLLMFVIGGFMWIISGGSSEKVQKGKDIIIGSVVGLLIVFSSYMIISYVSKDILQGKTQKGQDTFSDIPPEEGSEKCEENTIGVAKGECVAYETDDKGVVTNDGCKALLGTTYGQRDCGKNRICCLIEPECNTQANGKAQCTTEGTKDNPGNCSQFVDPTQGGSYEALPNNFRCGDYNSCCVPPDLKEDCKDINYCKDTCTPYTEKADTDYYCAGGKTCCVPANDPCIDLGGECKSSSCSFPEEEYAVTNACPGATCCKVNPCLAVTNQICIPNSGTCPNGDASEKCLKEDDEKCCLPNP